MRKDKLKDSSKYLKEWLKRSKEVSDAAPRVQEYLEYIDWENRTVTNSPPEAESISTSEIEKLSERYYSGLQSKLPMLPEIDPKFTLDVGSATASSTSAVVVYVSAISRLDTPATDAYASNAFDELNKIQYAYQFPSEIRSLVKEVFPTQEGRFNAANSAYDKFIAGHGELTSLALELRTFVEGIKGELFKQARNHEKENMKLDLVLERLYGNAANKIEVEEQIKQHSELTSELSELAKRRKTSEAKALWARVLNYTYILLTPLKI